MEKSSKKNIPNSNQSLRLQDVQINHVTNHLCGRKEKIIGRNTLLTENKSFLSLNDFDSQIEILLCIFKMPTGKYIVHPPPPQKKESLNNLTARKDSCWDITSKSSYW